MIQTEKYKLNLIETTDTFSPNPLNENAQKLEAALGAAGAAQAAETAAREALDSRVTVLEADKVKMVVGSYTGTGGAYGNTQTISLGFTPKAVFIIRPFSSSYDLHLVTQAFSYFDSAMGCNRNVAQVVEGGFVVAYDNHISFNSSNTVYHFVALV